MISDGTNAIVTTVDVGGDPLEVTYDSGRGEVFVTDAGADTISVIWDGKVPGGSDRQRRKRQPIEACDSAKGEVFITNFGSNTVSVISDSSDKVVANITVRRFARSYRLWPLPRVSCS